MYESPWYEQPYMPVEAFIKLYNFILIPCGYE